MYNLIMYYEAAQLGHMIPFIMEDISKQQIQTETIL